MKSKLQLNRLLSLGTEMANHDLGYIPPSYDIKPSSREYLTLQEIYVNRGIRHSDIIGLMDPTDSRLSIREGMTVDRLNRGMTNKQIAESLGITEGTVKIHIRNARMKTGVLCQIARSKAS